MSKHNIKGLSNLLCKSRALLPLASRFCLRNLCAVVLRALPIAAVVLWLPVSNVNAQGLEVGAVLGVDRSVKNIDTAKPLAPKSLDDGVIDPDLVIQTEGEAPVNIPRNVQFPTRKTNNLDSIRVEDRKFVLTEIDYKGQDVFSKTELNAFFGSYKGETSLREIERMRQELIALYASRGWTFNIRFYLESMNNDLGKRRLEFLFSRGKLLSTTQPNARLAAPKPVLPTAAISAPTVIPEPPPVTLATGQEVAGSGSILPKTASDLVPVAGKRAAPMATAKAATKPLAASPLDLAVEPPSRVDNPLGLAVEPLPGASNSLGLEVQPLPPALAQDALRQPVNPARPLANPLAAMPSNAALTQPQSAPRTSSQDVLGFFDGLEKAAPSNDAKANDWRSYKR